jgi:molybdopterin-binding protein
MALSARNHLPGVIEEIQRDTILAHVVIRVGEHLVESVITRRSVDELGLKVGDHVTAVVKATEVMVAKP